MFRSLKEKLQRFRKKASEELNIGVVNNTEVEAKNGHGLEKTRPEPVDNRPLQPNIPAKKEIKDEKMTEDIYKDATYYKEEYIEAYDKIQG